MICFVGKSDIYHYTSQLLLLFEIRTLHFESILLYVGVRENQIGSRNTKVKTSIIRKKENITFPTKSWFTTPCCPLEIAINISRFWRYQLSSSTVSEIMKFFTFALLVIATLLMILAYVPTITADSGKHGPHGKPPREFCIWSETMNEWACPLN